MDLVAPSQDLESWLLPMMPSSIKALSVVQIGQRLDIPGLEIRVPPKKKDGSRSTVFVATLEDEAEPDDVVVFCGKREEDKQEVQRLFSLLMLYFVAYGM